MNSVVKKVFRRENVLVVLLVAGALLGVIGVPQNIGISSDQILLALLGVLALDMLIERLGYLDRIETHIADLENKIQPRVSADNLFRSRGELPPFTLWLQQSDEIWVAGKNLFGLVAAYGRQIEQAAKSGKRFRFLVTNPDSLSLMKVIAVGSFAHPTAPSVEQLLREVLAHFERLCKNTPKGAIEIRLVDHVLTNTYLVVDGKKPHGQMVVEMYNYKISTGERLHIKLTRQADYRIFAFHLEQFESMWRDATPWQPMSDIPGDDTKAGRPAAVALEKLVIHSASYGKGKMVDITERVRSMITAEGRLEFPVCNPVLVDDDDPVPNVRKELKVDLSYAGQRHLIVKNEGEDFLFPPKGE
jgi:hypothetical protein